MRFGCKPAIDTFSPVAAGVVLFESLLFTRSAKNVLIFRVSEQNKRSAMFQLKPGILAMIIGSRTDKGRVNIGKAVELFGLCLPGERFVNPVTGVVTQLPHEASYPLWLVTGDVVAFDGRGGYAFVRAEHLMPLDKPFIPQVKEKQAVR